MTSPLILFTRSLADRLASLPVLTVTGTLPGYNFDVAYAGRLQINNAVGDCAVEVLPDSQLPDGYSVWVDNTTHEVVVQFPAYTPAPVYVPVKNGGMEEGPAGVSCGAGWKVGQYPGLGTITGAWSAAYTGSGQASITWPRERVKKGDTITASIDIRQGASDAGAVGGSVVLYFYDMQGNLVGDFPGNGVWNSNPAQQTSTVTASAPADGYSCVGASATRKRQNKPLYVDNARWDLITTAGIAGDIDIFLHVRVRDSAGRTADWSGWIAEKFIYYTSQPYPHEQPYEAFTSGFTLLGGAFRVPPPPYTNWAAEAFTAGLSLFGGALQSVFKTYVWPAEAFKSSATITDGTLRQVLRAYTNYSPEAFTSTTAITGGTLATKLISYTNYSPEAFKSSATITGGTLA